MTIWMAMAALAFGATGQDAARGGGMATDAAAACPAVPAPLPADYAGWAATTPIAAAVVADAAPMLPLGARATVTLGDAAAAHYAVAPEHQPAAGTHGGILAFTVAATGRYRVALGAPAWIDLVQGTTALHSVAHGHGPACTTIRKIVDFDLQPGRYLLQLSGTAAPTLAVMVIRVAG